MEKNSITSHSTKNEEKKVFVEDGTAPSKPKCGRNLLSRVIPNISVYYQKYLSSIITPNTVPSK